MTILAATIPASANSSAATTSAALRSYRVQCGGPDIAAQALDLVNNETPGYLGKARACSTHPPLCSTGSSSSGQGQRGYVSELTSRNGPSVAGFFGKSTCWESDGVERSDGSGVWGVASSCETVIISSEPLNGINAILAHFFRSVPPRYISTSIGTFSTQVQEGLHQHGMACGTHCPKALERRRPFLRVDEPGAPCTHRLSTVQLYACAAPFFKIILGRFFEIVVGYPWSRSSTCP